MLCISCKHNTQQSNALLFRVDSENKTAISININADISNIIDFTNLIDSFQYTPLEVSDECLIGAINKIIYHNNTYYILDREKAKALFCFDSNGHFERKIGNIGQGPGEFVQPTDFILTSSHIIILDQFAHKLLFFNLNGEFSHTINLKYKVHGITSLANDSLFLAKPGDNRNSDVADYELLVMDVNGEVRLKGIYNPYQLKYSISGYNSQIMNGKTIYAKPMSCYIYEITESEMKERYYLNITNNSLPKNYEELCEGNYENFIKNYKENYNYFSGQFIETDKFILFTVKNTKNLPVIIIYDKDSQEMKSGIMGANSSSPKFNEIKSIVFSIGNYLTVDGNHIIGAVDSYYISGKGEDNPLLFWFSLKN
ncbi:6-bladed beta-propeller [Bacteroidia bacterium]|nr:6-bladed beta-propeller [Bacteroidia bacterium]GHT26494.1 6-bladed beta-propeller [Bacteroidia bacterium]